jgi:hypothetical protein
MSVIPKKYFYDKIVLLLLSILSFLVVITVLSVLIRITAGQGSGDYFIEYRSNAGISAFQTGDLMAVLSFIAFVGVTLIISVVLSMKSYRIKREISLIVLALGIVLTLVAAIVSNALLALR